MVSNCLFAKHFKSCRICYKRKIVAIEMSRVCALHLNRPCEIFSSGEAIDGFVSVKLTTREYIEYIIITLSGHGCVSWSESAPTNKQDSVGGKREIIEFRSEETYANLKKILMCNGYLEAGEHTFPFSLELSDDCPGTFEGTLGSIRYNLSVALETKSSLKENIFCDINVQKLDDLNLHPEYKIPVRVEEIKTFCCLFCTDGRVFFTLTTPFGAYVPMQKLPLSLRIENQSMSDVTSFEIALMQTTTYTAKFPQHKQRTEENNVKEEDSDLKCLRLTTRLLKFDFEIPTVTPTNKNDDDCIIKNEYTLKIVPFMPGCVINPVIYMPIHIGTVPLEESLQLATETDVADGLPSAAVLASTSSGSDQPPGYQSFRPPSFSEAIKNNKKPPSFDSAITASAPPYESTVSERNRPFIGFQTPT